jgi:hypothetical protein
MKHRIAVLAAAASVVVGCGSPSQPLGPSRRAEPSSIVPVSFTTHDVTAESPECATDPGSCARVSVRFPRTVGGGTTDVRDNLDIYLLHDIVSRLRGFLPDEIGDPITTIDGLAAALLAEHRAFTEEFPEATASWFVEIDASVPFATSTVTTLDVVETSFTGGAHPNSRRRLVSFDTVTGHLLAIGDLSPDVESVAAAVERALRAEFELGPDDDLGEAGFWFPEDAFVLTDNVGVVADGLLFHWNAYEIAPYSMGPIEVLLPIDQLKGLTTRDDWGQKSAPPKRGALD